MTPGLDRSRVRELRQRYETELFENVIPFWMRHSPDREHGGYFNVLDRDGSVFDTAKYIWLQGREAWLFAKLYRKVDPRPEWLEMSKLGIDFLRKHAIRDDGRVYFKLSRDGQPITLQRKIFSECFYVMALAEYSRASGETKLLDEAKREFEKVWEFSKDLSKVGRQPMAGAPLLRNLAVPMILLNLIEELDDGGVSTYAAEIEECIAGVQLHVNESRRIVFENVLPDGGFLDTPEGRLLNPGHAIESGWFLQHWAQRLKRNDLSQKAANIIRWSHDRGWDNEFGGLYYFLDSENKPPLALEWDMKLWWPHCEALYAHLLNYQLFRDPRDCDLFLQTDRYTFDHFPDPQHGEWYGYLNRRGEVTHRLKGGPYKCAFHVPRALWLCWETLKQLEKE